MHMSTERAAHQAAAAMVNISHALTRLATAQERIGRAMEDANHLESLRFQRETEDRDRMATRMPGWWTAGNGGV